VPSTSSARTAATSASSPPAPRARRGCLTAGTCSSAGPTGRDTGSSRSATAHGDRARRPYRAPGLDAAPFSPRLSPDGRWLLHLAPIYGRLIPNPYAPHHARARNWLIVTDLRTGRSHRVSDERGLYFIGTTPWSPDGTRFTFTRRKYLQASGGRIYVASPGGGAPQLVAQGAREAGAWSPDGLRLVFNVGNACALRVVALDGSSTRLLRFRGCLPTWRP
jgi:hypothetical protein